MKQTSVSLLDELAERMDCGYLSDLRYLDPEGRARLAEQLEPLSAGAYPLAQWNDGLEYLAGEPPCPDARQAKAALLAALRSR